MDNQRHTLLFVDDEVNILHSLQRLFRREGYNILTASSGKDGIAAVQTNKVSLVISDNRMPEMEGVEFLARVKELSPDTIRFMLTGHADIKAVMAAINSGEVSRYITKPWDDDHIKLTVKEGIERYDLVMENRRLLEVTKRQNAELSDLNRNLEAKVEKKTRLIRDNFFGFIRVFADMMELYDPAIGSHSKRVADLAKEVACRMRIPEADIDIITAAAYLHTIGLIGIPKSIIENDEENMDVKQRVLFRHATLVAQELLSHIDLLKQVGLNIRSHKEGFDGSGYPDGLRGEEIPIGSRILAVCKLYDRLRHRKVSQCLHRHAIDQLRRESGKGLDPEVVEAFISFLGGYKDANAGASSGSNACTIVSLKELKPGMVTNKEITSASGTLLLAGGTKLTAPLIEKILRFNDIEPVADMIEVAFHGQTAERAC